MKALKIIAGIIAALAVIYLVLCLMGPNKMDGSASLEMKAPAYLIYNKVSDVKTWSEWGPWMRDDPDMKLSYGTVTKGQGASYSWDSNMGLGSMEIMEAVPNKALKTKLLFEGFEGHTDGDWQFEENGDKTKVTWGMASTHEVPFLMRGLMIMAEDTETFFGRGLKNIQEVVEKEAAEPKTYRGFKVNKIDYPAKHFIAKRETIPFDDMQKFYESNFTAIAGGVAKAGAKMDGMPCGLFYDWNEETKKTDMAAGIATKEKMTMDGFENIEIPETQALLIDYYGPYDGSGEAHYAIDDYMKERGITNVAMAMEEYITDPTTEPDPKKWLTKVYYILE